MDQGKLKHYLEFAPEAYGVENPPTEHFFEVDEGTGEIRISSDPTIAAAVNFEALKQ